MASSTQTERYRVLLVAVKSAKIRSRRGNKNAYVSLYTDKDLKLRTKLNSSVDSNLRWDEKFVFSIAEHEHVPVMHDSSSVYFEIYRKRKLWKDSWVGTARCNINSLFTKFLKESENSKSIRGDDECRDHSCNDYFGDSDSDEGYGKDPIYNNLSDDSSDHEIDFDDSGDEVRKGKSFEQKEQHRHAELKASVRLEVFKGLKLKGVLNVELEKQGYIESPGQCKWQSMAMPYEAFMGNQVGSNRQRKNLVLARCLYSDTQTD